MKSKNFSQPERSEFAAPGYWIRRIPKSLTPIPLYPSPLKTIDNNSSRTNLVSSGTLSLINRIRCLGTGKNSPKLTRIAHSNFEKIGQNFLNRLLPKKFCQNFSRITDIHLGQSKNGYADWGYGRAAGLEKRLRGEF